MAALGAARYPTDELEQLARERGCAAGVLLRLYRAEFRYLQRHARVAGFISVFALNRVREVLRRHDRIGGRETGAH